MTETPYMPLWIADYLGDTQHLTTEQHGAYLLLLMTMWRHGGRLRNDAGALARITRISPRRWHSVAPEVMRFFDVGGDFITQKRLEREHQKVLSITEKRSASGKAGGLAKSLKNKDVALASATDLLQQKPSIPYPYPDSKKKREKDISPSLFVVGQDQATEPVEPLLPVKRSETEFDLWWKQYPRKVDKGSARKVYDRIIKSETATHDQMMAGVLRYAAERASEDQKYTKHPTTWLNAEGWNNEALPSVAAARNGATGRHYAPTRADSAVVGIMSYLDEGDEDERFGTDQG